MLQNNIRTYRAGYIRQPTDYRAFIPNSLPPKPPLCWDAELLALLSNADQSLGRLDGVADISQSGYVRKYVRP